MTKNEAQFIDECINHHKPFVDEIIVLDHFSNDGTKEIAEKCGATVYQEDILYPSDRRNRMQELAKNDWCMHVDADELFDIRFLEKLNMILTKNSERSIIYLNRYNMPNGESYPDKQPRIVKKSRVEWYRNVHEIPVGHGETKPFDSVYGDEVILVNGPIIFHRVTDRNMEYRIKRLNEWMELLKNSKTQFNNFDEEIKHLEEEIKRCRELH